MWVRFLRRFAWSPPERMGRTTIVFPAGIVRFVRRQCAADAVAAGAAIPTTRPDKDQRT